MADRSGSVVRYIIVIIAMYRRLRSYNNSAVKIITLTGNTKLHQGAFNKDVYNAKCNNSTRTHQCWPQ